MDIQPTFDSFHTRFDLYQHQTNLDLLILTDLQNENFTPSRTTLLADLVINIFLLVHPIFKFLYTLFAAVAGMASALFAEDRKEELRVHSVGLLLAFPDVAFSLVDHVAIESALLVGLFSPKHSIKLLILISNIETIVWKKISGWQKALLDENRAVEGQPLQRQVTKGWLILGFKETKRRLDLREPKEKREQKLQQCRTVVEKCITCLIDEPAGMQWLKLWSDLQVEQLTTPLPQTLPVAKETIVNQYDLADMKKIAKRLQTVIENERQVQNGALDAPLDPYYRYLIQINDDLSGFGMATILQYI